VLLGHAFASLPIPVPYAERINIMAALASAISAGLWFLITERVVARWVPERWERLMIASLATLIGATAFTVWNQSVVNEKVYTISLLFFTIVSWLVIEWIEAPNSRKADRYIVLVCFLLGLGYANHPAGFLPLPAAGVALLATKWRTLMRWRLVLASVGALLLGLTPFAFEPIRAAYFPAINEGAPTACETKIAASCTFSKLTEKRLMDNINRVQYGEKVDRGAPYTSQVGMWWLYFKWQWLRDAHQVMQGLQFILGHELGHIRLHHVALWYQIAIAYSGIIPVLGPTLSRLREYSSDRHGARVSPNGETGLVLLASGRYTENIVAKTLLNGWQYSGSWLWQTGQPVTVQSGIDANGNGDAVQRIGWAIRACARRAPWRALCFEQGLAAHFMLRKRGIASVLYYGAKPDEDKGLVTHVWVRHGDLDVVGGEDASTFAVLTRFPPSAETSDPC